MKNPLLILHHDSLPAFTEIRPEHIEPALDQILTENRAQIKALVKQKHFTWQNLMQPLDDINDRLNFLWNTVNHLNAVINSEPLRKAYEIAQAKVTAYSTEVSQNKKLYQAVKSIVDGAEFKILNSTQQKILHEELRDFHLAGVDLEPKAKRRFAELEKKLAKLMNQFEQNVLDATQGWTKNVKNQSELAGLPESALHAARQAAEEKNLSGWLLTLDAPSYLAVMKYADSRSLREEMYTAYTTRASDQGPLAGRWDNSKIIREILKPRQELAQLLGLKNYAELSVIVKTAENTEQVLDFLHNLSKHSLAKARQEFAELSQFAQTNYQLESLQAWDIYYFSEKLRQQKFAISDEQLRPYFSENQVLEGLFSVVKRLYNVRVEEVFKINVWHPDVRFFAIYDQNNHLRGQFYLDLYARENKRGGAWMEECRSHRRLPDGELQTAVAYITCNFSRPIGHEPALFTHDEVQTLFHEFGHGLQQMLTKVDYLAASGTNGVPWDVVEFPSQFMENWCWEQQALQLIAKHYQTKQPLPTEIYKTLRNVKNFQSGMQMMRQLEFSLFDFRLHKEFDPKQRNQMQKILTEIRDQIGVYPVPKFNRFAQSFSHIFGSSYAAGYYSYKWAEVWSSDAFSKFTEKGIFDYGTGQEFLHNILEKGSSEDALKLFIAFRGRAPKVDALLKDLGGFPLDPETGQECL